MKCSKAKQAKCHIFSENVDEKQTQTKIAKRKSSALHTDQR